MKLFFYLMGVITMLVYWNWDGIQKDIAEGRELRWKRQTVVCSTHGGYAYSSRVSTGFMAHQRYWICKDGTQVPAR